MNQHLISQVTHSNDVAPRHDKESARQLKESTAKQVYAESFSVKSHGQPRPQKPKRLPRTNPIVNQLAPQPVDGRRRQEQNAKGLIEEKRCSLTPGHLEQRI